MNTCATHYSNDEENIRKEFRCFQPCGRIDSLVHWKTCSFYSYLRELKNLDNIEDLCEFYRSVIKKRVEESKGN